MKIAIVYHTFDESTRFWTDATRMPLSAGQKKTVPLTKIRGAAIMSIEKVLAARVSSHTL